MPNYQKTKRACYLGFITQAIAANFAPLLFLKFHTDYHISLGNIALISTCFFFTQLLIDWFCARFVDKISSGAFARSFYGNYHQCYCLCCWKRTD